MGSTSRLDRILRHQHHTKRRPRELRRVVPCGSPTSPPQATSNRMGKRRKRRTPSSARCAVTSPFDSRLSPLSAAGRRRKALYPRRARPSSTLWNWGDFRRCPLARSGKTIEFMHDGTVPVFHVHVSPPLIVNSHLDANPAPQINQLQSRIVGVVRMNAQSSPTRRVTDFQPRLVSAVVGEEIPRSGRSISEALWAGTDGCTNRRLCNFWRCVRPCGNVNPCSAIEELPRSIGTGTRVPCSGRPRTGS